MSDELLKKILDKLDGLDREIQDTKVQMNSRFDTLETKVSRIEGDVTSIKASVERIESDTPQDVMGMLKQINAKLDTQQDLTRKVADHGTDIKLIKKLLTNQ